MTDSSLGIPENNSDNVLEAYHRQSRARENSQGVFDLELVIVKMITEGHEDIFLLSNIKP